MVWWNCAFAQLRILEVTLFISKTPTQLVLFAVVSPSWMLLGVDDDLSKIMATVQEYLASGRLKLSTEKTVCLVFSHQKPSCRVSTQK